MFTVKTGIKLLHKFLPPWTKELSKQVILDDLIAGITVALILIPQSIAYAQLAGLPVQYGLYAAFIPPLIAAFFGSSRQLSTGPVAVVSLLTASVLSQLVSSDPGQVVGYAVFLALIVGVIQLTMGQLRLGALVNFISHPVLLGFSNAAALIIATSQLPKVFGVSVDSYEHHYETLYHLFLNILQYVHWPSILLSIATFLLLYIIKYWNRKLPAILIAVIITTSLAWYINFETKKTIAVHQIQSTAVVQKINEYNELVSQKNNLSVEKQSLRQQLNTIDDKDELAKIKVSNEISRIDYEIEEVKKEQQFYRELLRSMVFVENITGNGRVIYSVDSFNSTDFFRKHWRLQIGEGPIIFDTIGLVGGGSVVGKVPQGLPALQVPPVDLASLPLLFNSAIVIALLGFMESISIAKALAVKTGHTIDPNKELIGQGLANIAGSFSQSYPVSGSFSRTAVNYQSGAKTGLSSFFSSGFVLITLLFFTPLLYYIPQPVLAVIIITSVIGLVNFEKISHAWRIQKSDGVIAIITFLSTLFFAPDLDQGILLGILLSTGYYIFTRTRPHISLMTIDANGLTTELKHNRDASCSYISILQFDGSLIFANASYLENKILGLINSHPRKIKYIILIADGINYIDFSGVEALLAVTNRLHEAKKQLVLVGLKSQVLEVIKRSDLYEKLGENNIFHTEVGALKKIFQKAHIDSHEKDCPFFKITTKHGKYL